MRLLSLILHGFRRTLRRSAARLRRRHLLIPCILAAQFSILALIFLSRGAIEALPAAAPRISMFNVHASAEVPVESAPQLEPAETTPQPEPVRPETPVPEVDLKLQTLALPAQPVFSAAAAARAGFGTTCDIAEALGRAFAEDEFIRGELARIGPQSRSVSNAIMLWNAHWVDLSADAPKEAVETLRRAILEGVTAAPAECLAQDLTGPRFIFVDNTSPTMILVLGSGTWRWEQLLNAAESSHEVSRVTQQGRED